MTAARFRTAATHYRRAARACRLRRERAWLRLAARLDDEARLFGRLANGEAA